MTEQERNQKSEDLTMSYGIREAIYHEMSGYNRSYDYALFESKVEVLEDGKFKGIITETIYHGDVEDNGEEYDCDKGETTVYAEGVFETEEELDDFIGCTELEYQGNTEQTYPGGLDHSDCD